MPCALLLCLLSLQSAAAPSVVRNTALLAQAASEEDEEIPQGGRPVTPETERKVRAFLERFIDPDKTPEEQADLFTERADYYERGYVGTDEIRRDVERYVLHWPQRKYTLDGISYMSADPESDRIFVSYTVRYELARGSTSTRGTASYGAIIVGLENEPKIESIREKINARKPASNE